MTQSRTLAGFLTVLATAVAGLALLAPVASAIEPGYEQFKGCPTEAQNAETVICNHSVVKGGHLQMGSKTVPIEHPITLTGGVNEEFEGFAANSEGGLTKVQQKVPGGVIGLTGLTWLLEFFGSEALTLYATTELAGPPTGFNIESVTLPIKVHLTTPSGVLGNNCYIGSNSSPITLHLITGTTSPPSPNKPISGKAPEFSVDELGIVHLTNGVFVDNSFSAPGVNGCVLKLFGFIPISLNGFVNEQAGLPSAAGKNETVQEIDIEFANRELVY